MKMEGIMMFGKKKATPPPPSPEQKQALDQAQEQKPPLDRDTVFRANLKYISRCEASAERIAAQFVKSQSRFWLTIGTADFPTGQVIVADPLAYLPQGKFSPVLEKEIPAGSHRVDVALCRNEYVGVRICTARLKLTDAQAVRYELAKPTPETAAAGNGKEAFAGFPVDAGMMCFCDRQTAGEFQSFLQAWHSTHEGKNHYDDYFAKFFADSFQQYPAYQREGGDFIQWENPDTGRRMVMAASGFGDGFYQSFWGYDDQNALCELIVPMVDPDLFDE